MLVLESRHCANLFSYRYHGSNDRAIIGKIADGISTSSTSSEHAREWTHKDEEERKLALKRELNFHKKGLEIEKDLHGQDVDHPDIASSLGNMANCHESLGQHEEAVALTF